MTHDSRDALARLQRALATGSPQSELLTAADAAALLARLADDPRAATTTFLVAHIPAAGPQAGEAPLAEAVPLTVREQEVADLAADGLSNREIARQLFLSVRTVESHIARVLRKRGLRSRAALARHLEAPPAAR